MRTPRKHGLDHRQLRAQNEKRIMGLLQARGPLTRTEMVELTGLDPKSITNIVRELETRAVIAYPGRKKSSRGRTVQLIELRRDRNLALGINVERDRVLALAINAYGEALWQWDRPSPVSGAPALRQTLAAICHDCFSRRHLSVEHFWGIGLSAPGLLDSTRTTWTLSRQMPQLVGETPAEQLTDATGLPAQLEDNSRAKALAERLWGWGREHDHFLLVDLDRGIGSGIILDGRLFRGVTGHSGEIGQFHVRPDIRPPSGPAHDFLEEAVGLDALVARYNLAAQPETIPDFGPLFDKARQGDSHAREILEEAGRLMGVTLANMRNFFDLPICLTGRLLQAGELVTQPMETAFRENSLLPNGDLGRTHLPENGAALGAAALIYVAVLTI